MNVHLVGSIGLDTVDEVFRTVGELLGPYLRRVPDGEGAANFATAQQERFIVCEERTFLRQVE